MNTGRSHVGREGRRGRWGEEKQAMKSEEGWKKDCSLDLDWKKLGLEFGFGLEEIRIGKFNWSSESTELEGVHKGRRGGGEVCYLHALVWSLGRVAVTT